MRIHVKTNLGSKAARKIAMFDAGGRQVSICSIFAVPGEPGFYSYVFRTS